MSQCSTETEKGWGYFHVKETVCKKSVSSESMEHCDLIQLMGRHLLIDNTIFIVHKQSGGKIMFSHLSVSHSVQRRGHVWQGACVAGGMSGEGMHGRGGVHGGGHAWWGTCRVGGYAWGHVWWGVCMAEGLCMAGACMVGVCMAGRMHGGGHVWQGAYVAGGMHGRGMHGGGVHGTEACVVGHAYHGVCMEGGMHGRGDGDMHDRRDAHCSGLYASYWNAFLFINIISFT